MQVAFGVQRVKKSSLSTYTQGYSISYEPSFLSLHCLSWNLIFPPQIHSLCASHLGHKSKQKKLGV